MIPIIQDAELGSDLDANRYRLVNVASIVPVPDNLISADDPRLTDLREPLPGSVVNSSVAAAAAIDQSKLALNGQIPTAWLGTTPGTAAPGDLAEYVTSKGQPNGYAALDSTGKIPSINLPDAVGLGTVSSIGLSMPGEFQIPPPNPITTAGTLTVHWTPQPNPAWFGTISGGTPTFQTTAFPAALIPNVPASRVASGVFDPARLPLATFGASHQAGKIPDPGDGSVGNATDYLARNMTYKVAPTIAVGYQPALPSPSVSSQPDGVKLKVFAGSTVADVTFFYSLTSAVAGFTEFPEPGIVVVDDPITHHDIWIYSARSGWNNSPVVTLHWP